MHYLQLLNSYSVYYCPGLIILNAWYGKFVSETSQKQEKSKVIDVTVPLQCLVKDSKLILTESPKVSVCQCVHSSHVGVSMAVQSQPRQEPLFPKARKQYNIKTATGE